MVTAVALSVNPRTALPALVLAALPVLPLLAAGAPAGTIIENTATATYDDGGVIRNASSNTVQVRVDEVLDVTVASLDSGPLTVRSGGTAVLAFQVTNTGNGPESIALEAVTSVAGNAFDAVPDAIAIDSNGNGVYDAGVDQVLPGPATLTSLPAEASQTVFVIVSAPAGLADGAQSAVNLVARTATGSGAPGTLFAGSGEGGGDAVVGASGGTAVATGQLVASASTVTLVKSASVADPFGGSSAVPGAIITYSITALVSGSADVDALRITDAIPPRTQYRAGTLQLDGAPLTDAAGDDAGEATPATVSFDLGTVPGGASRTVSFAVSIEE